MRKPFPIIIDCLFADINTEPELTPINKKSVFCLSNTFEAGEWEYAKFYDFLLTNIAQTALTRRERDDLFEEPGTLLRKATENLRLSEDDGEIGEICLYGIMRTYYNAISVVPKIFYKQNYNDPAKGADSVHIVIENDNNFSLWFGEAKFYNSIEDTRLYEIIESVHNSLEPDKIKKENSIITNLNEIENSNEISESLKQKIYNKLSGFNSIDEIKPILHIPILLLYECEITKQTKHFDDPYKQKITKYFKDRANSYFKKQINKCRDIDMYSEVYFHLILFPVPDKQKIVSRFMEKTDALRR